MKSDRAARWKLALFSLLPAVLLFGAAEVLVRLTGLARPSLQSVLLPEEAGGLLQHDSDLFWSLRPDSRLTWRGQVVTTNSLGFRGPEPGAKLPGEFRILSLGESSTFGVGVPDDATYSAVLEELLRRRWPSRSFTVINAGVSAWSSFQSLKLLELRGFDLQPDLVLFYHEVNDYLPSSLRDASNTEIGVLKTDRQLYEARANRLHGALMQGSALYRLLAYRYAGWRVQRFDRQEFENPLLTIGLPDVTLEPRLTVEGAPPGSADQLNEKSLGRRVSDPERWEILEELLSQTAAAGVGLIVIHPSYRDSSPHDCLLTRFCRERGVPMVEAYHSLHDPGRPPNHRYLDSMHPNRAGHRQLALDLYGAIAAEFLEQGAR